MPSSFTRDVFLVSIIHYTIQNKLITKTNKIIDGFASEKFNISLYFQETWAVNEKSPNIIVSPYSLVAPLGTLALASEGTSQEQILKAFRVETTSQVANVLNE